jgi:hypothetical protein
MRRKMWEMHSKETKKTGKKGRVEAVGRDSVGF